MSDHVQAFSQTGLERACPVCDAQPGEYCQSAADGHTRRATHQERKPKAEEE